jgi:hypothetical protein
VPLASATSGREERKRLSHTVTDAPKASAVVKTMAGHDGDGASLPVEDAVYGEADKPQRPQRENNKKNSVNPASLAKPRIPGQARVRKKLIKSRSDFICTPISTT